MSGSMSKHERLKLVRSVLVSCTWAKVSAWQVLSLCGGIWGFGEAKMSQVGCWSKAEQGN